LLGLVLKRVEWIDDNFIRVASGLVFNVTMPALLFLGILHADLHTALRPSLLVYFTLATVLSFAGAWGWALWRCPYADRGVYVQGAFRGNNGIIGLALAASLYGAYGISMGAVLAGLVILFYNALSAIVLAIYSPVMKSDPWSLLVSILRNPLIISVLAAIPFAYWQIGLPGWLEACAQNLGNMTLPLASLRESSRLAISASLVKMIGLPFIGTLGAWLYGFRGPDLGILFLYFAAPTASSSYIMARAAQGNHQLAAAIVVITTVAAAVTTNVGVFILRWGGWI
jgi:predicted permease